MTSEGDALSPTTLEKYAAQCEKWLSTVTTKRTSADSRRARPFEVFHNLSHDAEAALLDDGKAWQATKFDAGYGAISWDPQYGGAGLTSRHEKIFAEREADFVTPKQHETLSVTVSLIAPTIRELGTEEQRNTFVQPFLRADWLCCQLFSEPGAGSDLAGLTTRAARTADDTWKVSGHKIWSSGAQFSEWGMLLARTDPDAPKHRGITAFLVPMDAAGIEVRPIKQMSGGSSFNEVFLDDVELPDSLRLGGVGEGWTAALTTLGFERSASAASPSVGGTIDDLIALAKRLGASGDADARRRIAETYVHVAGADYLARRNAELGEAGRVPGVEGSVAKLVWTQNLKRIADTAAELLGPRMLADNNTYQAYAWSDHLLGAPGYRIAGGTDEVQRNIIAERGLGLPRDPAR